MSQTQGCAYDNGLEFCGRERGHTGEHVLYRKLQSDQPAPQASDGPHHPKQTVEEWVATHYPFYSRGEAERKIAAFVAAELEPLRELVEKWRKRIDTDFAHEFGRYDAEQGILRDCADELVAALDRIEEGK